jgi:energy-coupling factor transporter transmembrane protein EcfT
MPSTTELHLLRLVPGDSPVHRLWAGTKIVALAVVAVVATLHPTWTTLAVFAALLASAIALARVPLGAAPRLPRWFYVGVALGAFLSLWSAVPPVVRVRDVVLSLGGLDEWARFVLLAAILVIAAALVGWTTPAGEFAPALARLTRPLRWLPLPVDEWLVAIALSLRCFPLLVDEVRTLLLVRRLRAPDARRTPARTRRARLHARLREAVDLLTAALVSSLRRARDMADAIDARGGLGSFSDSHDVPHVRDAAVLAFVVILATVTFFVS